MENNIWSDGFIEPNSEFPYVALQNLIDPFTKASKNFASLNIAHLEEFQTITSGLGNLDFQYLLYLGSQVLTSYSYELFKFGHNVTLYPLKIIVNNEIASELSLKKTLGGKYELVCETEKDFILVASAILKSEKFRKTVGGLIKLGNSQK